MEGVYRDGGVELLGRITEAKGKRVIVTWLPPIRIDLREHGMDEN